MAPIENTPFLLKHRCQIRSIQKICGVALAALLLSACAPESSKIQDPPSTLTWPQVKAAAEGTTVRLGMWTGDPRINAYVREHLAGPLKDKYGIDLHIVSSPGGNTVSRLTVPSA